MTSTSSLCPWSRTPTDLGWDDRSLWTPVLSCCRVWSRREGSGRLLGLLGSSRSGFPPSGAGSGSTLVPRLWARCSGSNSLHPGQVHSGPEA